MSKEKRKELIEKIETHRNSVLICYLTSLRPNVAAQMADDQVRVFMDHLEKLTGKVKKLDIYLVSNGGSATVPWRLVSLFREFAESFNVIIPYRAYSAASLLALGADEIVMHPFAELGPIDPTVSNEFNPVDGVGRRIGINVEDVTAYVHFVRETVGINHQDELIRALEALTAQVHPLALGNVERFLSQTRMIAKKILRTHMEDGDSHKIDEIVENMASRLYFHGHPINREEAKRDLDLKVIHETQEFDSAVWELYKGYEQEFRNQDLFNPVGELNAALTEPDEPLPSKEHTLLHCVIESRSLRSSYTTKHRYSAHPSDPNQPAQFRDDVLEQGWTHEA